MVKSAAPCCIVELPMSGVALSFLEAAIIPNNTAEPVLVPSTPADPDATIAIDPDPAVYV